MSVDEGRLHEVAEHAHRRTGRRRCSGRRIGAATSRNAQAVLPPLPNTVQQWNKIAEDTVVGSGAFQGEGEIYMSYASLAVYDAVVAIQGGYEPYGPAISAPTGASLDCAVVEAAYRTLRHYFSTFPALVASLDGYYSEALSPLNLNGCTGGGERNERRLGSREQHHRASHWRRAADTGWYDLAVRNEGPRPRSVASHTTPVLGPANAVARVGATLPAEEPGPIPARTSGPTLKHRVGQAVQRGQGLGRGNECVSYVRRDCDSKVLYGECDPAVQHGRS